MPRSNGALRAILLSSMPRVSKTAYSDHAYWQVTFSVAPGLDLTVTVCDHYIDEQTAIDQATVTLREIIGQIVTEVT